MKLLEAALVFAVTAILAPLFVDDLREILPWAAQRLLRRAARMLPTDHCERYTEEWTGELAAIPGRLPKLVWALRITLGAPAVNRELRGLPPFWLALLRRLSSILTAGWLLATGLLPRPSQTTVAEPEADPEALLRTTEVARRLGVSARAVLVWAQAGKLPSILTPGGHRRYPAQGVEQVLQAMTADGEPRTTQGPNR
jgi:excisionase family DNA binding protein